MDEADSWPTPHLGSEVDARSALHSNKHVPIEAAVLSDIECEQALLGAILVSHNVFDLIAELVTAADFSEPLHSSMFAMLASPKKQGRTIDIKFSVAAFRVGANDKLARGLNGGAIQQDADPILFVYPGTYYAERAGADPAQDDLRVARLGELSNLLEAILAKQRSGPVCTVPLFFNAASNAARNLGRAV